MQLNPNSLNFILIDDDPVYGAIMARCAEMEGVTLHVYKSLMELGSVGLLGQYDAVLVDYDLNQMNGLEVAEYLKAFFENIPMVLVSAKNRDHEVASWSGAVEAFALKSDGYHNVFSKAKSLVRKQHPVFVR